MTDQGPRSLLPGQGMLRPQAPYGMTAGVRSVLPGINDRSPTAWNRNPEPDKIDLDAPTANPPEPGPVQTEMAPSAGWELTDPSGSVIHLRSNAHKKRDSDEVTALGNALANHAVTPEEKETAARATEWGMAQVGRADIGDITKQMTHVWDMGSANANKVTLQGIRSKANRGGTGGVPAGAAGPTKAEKYAGQLNKELIGLTNVVIEKERTDAKSAALSELENQIGLMEQEMSSNNAMAQRISRQELLKTLTGKASTASERAGIEGGAGKLAQLQNSISEWVSPDPVLVARYIQKFRGVLSLMKQAARKQREQRAVQAATRMRNQAAVYGEDQAGEAANIVYESLSGNARKPYQPPEGMTHIGDPAPATPAGAAPAGDEFSKFD